MTNVFLAPCDSSNFEETVVSPVDLADHPDHPDELGDGPIRLWGAREGTRNESNFEKMERGDLVLFYRDGDYVATARVDTTVHDEAGWASTTLWEDRDVSLVYTVTDFESIRVPREKVNRLFEYSSSYTPNGLLRVNPSNVDSRIEAIEVALERVSSPGQ